MIRANTHAYILCRLRDPTYRSVAVDPDVDPDLAAAIMASLQELEFDASQIAAAIEESKRTAAASSSAEPYMQTHEYSMQTLKRSGLRVVGGVKPMPVGIARGSDIRKTFNMVDVEPDGNCGAYTLSIVNFAANGTVMSEVEVRNRLVALAPLYIAPEWVPNYIDATRVQNDGSVRYLEQQELAVFCESLNVNCVIFGLRLQGRVQNYTAFSHVVNPVRPYAVFVNTRRGNHYELVVRMRGQSGSSTFSLLLAPSDVMDLLAMHTRTVGQAPIESPPSSWFENYEFFKDDFVFTDPPAPSRPSKKQKCRWVCEDD
tara:strand:+ start:434 stop:1378 length:945 start_codon:yes stop_codon:yes gene_type:complete